MKKAAQHMARSHPPFTVQMLEFEGNFPIPRGRLTEPSATLEDAEVRGKREASNLPLRHGLGFRVLDATGKQVFC